MFLDSQEGVCDAPVQKDGLQTTALMYLTECYTSCCVHGHLCYAYSCPKQVKVVYFFYPSGVLLLCLWNHNCGFRDNLHHSFQRLPHHHHLQWWYAHFICVAGPRKIINAICIFRVWGGNKCSHQKSLHPSLKGRSHVKHKVIIAGGACYLNFTSRLICKLISKERQYIKDLDFVEGAC